MLSTQTPKCDEKQNIQKYLKNQQLQQEYHQISKSGDREKSAINQQKKMNQMEVQIQKLNKKSQEISKQMKKSLRLLQNATILKNKYSNEEKKLMGSKQIKIYKIFSKASYNTFAIKIRKILILLSSQQQYYKFIKQKGKSILNWLVRLFKNRNKQEFLQNANQERKKHILKIIQKLYLIKNLQLKHQDIQQNQTSINKWFQQFNKKHNLLQQPSTIADLQQRKEEQISNQVLVKSRKSAQQQFGFIRINKLISIKSKVVEQKLTMKCIKEESLQKQSKRDKQIIYQDDQQNVQLKCLKLKKVKCFNKSCKEELEEKKCNRRNHMILICEKCNSNNHICKQNIKCTARENYQQNIKINAIGSRLKNYSLKRLTAGKNKNNILEVIKDLGYEFITTPKIIPGTPRQIICNYPILGTQVYDQIMKNRIEEGYLPLQIKQSQVEGAGLGVFATHPINRIGTLICSYLGQMGNGSVTPALRIYNGVQQMNNSFFTLGWFNDDIMLIAPSLFANVGRFINYNVPSKCNVQPILCLLEKSKNDYELAVFLINTRKIKAGEQLFYNYGPDY